MMRCAALVVIVCMAAARSATARAAAPDVGELNRAATLLGPDLRAQAVTLRSVGGGVIRYFDADRVLRQASLDDLVEIRFPDAGDADAPPAERQAELVLVDGRRYRGRYVGADARQRLVVEHPRLGPLAATLEELAELRFDADIAAAQGLRPLAEDADGAAAHDSVTLLNGDRLEGWVSEIAGAQLMLETASGSLLAAPLDRIAVVRLAGGRDAAIAGSGGGPHHLLLRDGTRVAMADFAVDRTLHAALADGPTVELPLSAVAAVAVRGPAGTLVNLLDLPLAVEQPAVVFGAAWPSVRRDDAGKGDADCGGALHLHSPTVLRFELPRGAARLTAALRLDVPDDHPRRAWASMDVRIEQAGQPTTTLRIDAERPRASISMAVEPGPLRLRVEQAEHGPVLDRLRLADTWVLVAP